jgi:RNA polymerase sigma-70 factor (ECF subfamily)
MPDSFDETRFIEALTTNQPALEAYCYANTAKRQDAREVYQAACVKLWQKAADWDPDTTFLPWAFTVARFTILSHYRDKKRDRLIFDADVIEAMATETEPAASAYEDRKEALAACMKKVSDKQLRLLNKHYTMNQSLREIAEGDGRSLSAVKMNLMRLRQSLRSCINQHLQAT